MRISTPCLSRNNRVCGESGGSNTPRLHGSITSASDYWIARSKPGDDSYAVMANSPTDLPDGRASAARCCDPVDLRATPNLSRRIKLICPVQSCLQKYFCFSEIQIKLYPSPSRPTQRGVSRSSRTLERDAVDADGAGDEST